MSPRLDPAIAATVRHTLDVAVSSWPAPAAAVQILDRDSVLLEHYAGSADPVARRPLTAADRFEIGSISKSFTGFVIAMLVDEGRLDPDAPVQSVLPWFTVRSQFRPITLRHLLHHTSGLITGSDALPDAYAHAWSARDTDTGTPPGEFFHYSNLGYVVLQLVIERVTGRPLAVEVAQRILEPAGMLSSAAAVTATQYPLMAVGHQALHADRTLLPGDPLIPATWLETVTGDGNVVATPGDLGRYARMLLGRGRLDDRAVAGPAVFKRMITDLAEDGEPSAYPSRYGFGLNVEQVEGHTWLTHGGGMIGYSTFLAVDLDAGLAVVALTTAPGEWPIAESIARPLLSTVTADPASTAAGSTVLRPRTLVLDAQRYLGDYIGTGSERVFTVEAVGDRLHLRDTHGTGLLYETGQGRLFCDHPAWRTFPHTLLGFGEGRRWTYAGDQFAPAGADPPAVPVSAHPLPGEYRCYSPWYPNFQIVQRANGLHLIAMNGVESHTDEPELVALGSDRYRIGSDPRLPERLLSGPVVDDQVIWVERDGCRYSRVFRR